VYGSSLPKHGGQKGLNSALWVVGCARLTAFLDFFEERTNLGFGTEIASSSAFGVRLRKRKLE
jgi:hypothetical protein